MKNTLTQTLGIIVLIASFLVGKFLGLYYLLFFGVCWLGWYLASWYSQKNEENSLTKFIAWINLVTWFIPIVGLFTVFASFKLNQSYGKKNKIYIVLAIIGLVLSIINGALGAIANLNIS